MGLPVTTGSATGPRRRRCVPGLILVAVTTVIVLGACGTDARPLTTAWEAQWRDAQVVIPSRSRLGAPPAEATCDRVLGELRSVREPLLPTPDPLVDDTVEKWLAFAETAFFSCFENVPGTRTVDGTYRQLARLAAEVDTALDTVRPPGAARERGAGPARTGAAP